MPKSVLLLSGGLDSTVNAALAAADVPSSAEARATGGGVLLALTCDYGQRAAAREIAAARAVCRHYGIKHKTVNLRWLGDIADTPLTRRDAPLPDPRTDGEAESDALVWIPNRNGVLMSVAAAHAEALGADRIVAGFNAEEAASFPDNSADFLAALNRSFEYSVRSELQAFSYTVELDKAQIMRIAQRQEVPIELSWCCYGDGDERCWRCGSCVRFLDAVESSGCADWLASRGLKLPSGQEGQAPRPGEDAQCS